MDTYILNLNKSATNEEALKFRRGPMFRSVWEASYQKMFEISYNLPYNLFISL